MSEDVEELALVQPTRGDFDTLTGFLHRQAFDRKLTEALAHCAERDEVIAVMIADLDRFKAVNDRFGIWPGQRVLRSVAQLLQSLTPDRVVVGRYGGDEFSFLSVGATESQAQSLAELTESEVSRLKVNFEGQDLGPLTISTGLSFCPRDGTRAEDLIRAAYSAVVRRKRR